MYFKSFLLQNIYFRIFSAESAVFSQSQTFNFQNFLWGRGMPQTPPEGQKYILGREVAKSFLA